MQLRNQITQIQIMNEHFFINSIGEAFQMTSIYLFTTTDLTVRFTTALIGAPTTKLWTGVPYRITGANVVRNNIGVNVSNVTSNGGTANPKVIYYNNDGTTGMFTSNSMYASPNSSILIKSDGMIPWIAPLKIQNTTLQNSQYVFASDFSIGKDVDANRTEGNVVIASGAEYEVEATGDVLIGDGTIISGGATLRIWTPGTVTIHGGMVSNTGKIEIYSRDIKVESPFSVEKGGIVLIENYNSDNNVIN